MVVGWIARDERYSLRVVLDFLSSDPTFLHVFAQSKSDIPAKPTKRAKRCTKSKILRLVSIANLLLHKVEASASAGLSDEAFSLSVRKN
jgi:hypothetical protein